MTVDSDSSTKSGSSDIFDRMHSSYNDERSDSNESIVAKNCGDIVVKEVTLVTQMTKVAARSEVTVITVVTEVTVVSSVALVSSRKCQNVKESNKRRKIKASK